ncbi:MAG TPA: hypothetical protein VGH59_10465 [Casimicrobiaceae bacterium]|jgi:predicted  nucleic acid-binding Zn-ribbon protein
MADRPTWDEYTAKLNAAIQAIVDAQNALAELQDQLSQVQEDLRDLSDTPPGSVPDIGGP